MKRKYCGDDGAVKRHRGEVVMHNSCGTKRKLCEREVDPRMAKRQHLHGLEAENAVLMAEIVALRKEVGRLEMVLAHYIRSMSAPGAWNDTPGIVCCN